MSNKHCKLAALLALTFIGGFAGGPALAQSVPPVGNVQMPLVSPQQADQFFATRVVPPSSVSAVVPAVSSAQPLQSVNVDPILGHDLPTDAMSAAGLPRADFATARPDDEKKRSAVAGAAVVGGSAPSTTVIQQSPPVIGKP
jgi:hypothetical protein